ncbi:MAG: AI-2E family transporter [Gammaproteobacteria bacterium]|jgi:predicted PurR-regulated permease PerM|nr:AI-2E family transporter [Gammaproteobacteria bacterium]
MKDSFAPASRAIMVTAALVIIIAGMKLAAPLLVPFLLSIFIAVISFPLMSQLQQSGLSKGLSLTLVMLLVVFIGIGLTLLIGSSLTDFSRTLPDYQQRITTEWGQAIVWLKDHGISVAEQLKGIADPAAAMGLISSILKGFGNVLTNSFLIILTVVFILMETAGVTQKVLLLRDQADDEQSDKKVFSQVFVEKLRDYMSMKTIISMMTGIIVAIAMWLIGLDYPVLWGVLAFMLNFVPNIGSIIAAVPAVMLAMVQLGVSSALLVAGVYVAVNVLIGSVIEPRYMGKGLGLSTLVVFVSLVFWGWVLGPVGMLLSVPLTITVKLALDCKPETQWLGHLLGPLDD